MGFFAYALNDKCGCGLFGVLLFWIFADALRIVHGGGAFPDCFVAVAPRNDGRESSRAMTGEEDVGMTGGLAE